MVLQAITTAKTNPRSRETTDLAKLVPRELHALQFLRRRQAAADPEVDTEAT